MPTGAEGFPVAALFEVNEVLCGAGVDATPWGAVQFDSDLAYEFVGSAELAAVGRQSSRARPAAERQGSSICDSGQMVGLRPGG